MLGRVGQRLGDDVVGADLHPIGQPFLEAQVELNRDRRAAGNCPQRRAETALGQQCRMNAPGQITQLFQRPAGLLDGMVESHPKLPRIRRHLGLRHAKLQRKRDKPLLGAVVQVALDVAAGLIGGGDHPRARRGKLGIQLGVVQRHRQLTSNQVHGVETVGGESPTDQPVLQQQHRPQHASAEDRNSQQRAAVGIGEVGVASEAIITGGVGARPVARASVRGSAAPTSDLCRSSKRHRRGLSLGAANGDVRRPTPAALHRWRRSWRRVPAPPGHAIPRCWFPSSAPATSTGCPSDRWFRC